MKSLESLKLNDLKNPIWVYDAAQLRIAWANQSALDVWEAESLHELCTRNFESRVTDTANQRVINILRECETGRTVECWWKISPHEGVQKKIFITCSATKLDNGKSALLVEAIDSELLNQLNGEINKNSMFVMLNEHGSILSYNPIFEEQFGNQISAFNEIFEDQAASPDIPTLQLPFETDALLNTLSGRRWHRVEWYQKASSSHIFMTLRDINDRKTNELKLAKASITDSLTGLLNRRGLNERLEQLKEQHYTIFYIDLDGFKPINDSYGHLVGDEFLKQTAQTLQNKIHPNAICARLGGDEFYSANQ